MTASSWKQLSDSLGTSRMQQKRCCITSKSRSEEATWLPPVLLGFSLWEKHRKKFGYPETAMLERPHVSMPVKGLADCQHQLPAMWDTLDTELCPAFRWLQPLLAFDCNCMKDPKQELPRSALPDLQNHEQNKTVNWLCFFKLFLWE